MDQTPVWLSIGSTGKTVDIKGSKNVNGYLPKGVNPREKISVILACDSKGEKLPPAIIVKSGVRAKPFEYLNGVLVFNNPKTSMANSDIMSKWIELTIPFEDNKKTMLILDSFRGHLTEQVKKTCDNRNLVRAVIPGGMTKYLQPLDLTVNRSFKSKVKKYYRRIACNHVKDEGQTWRSLNMDVFTKVIRNAWEEWGRGFNRSHKKWISEDD